MFIRKKKLCRNLFRNTLYKPLFNIKCGLSNIVHRHTIPIYFLLVTQFLMIIVVTHLSNKISTTIISSVNHSSSNINLKDQVIFYRRQSCSCVRSLFKKNHNMIITDEEFSSLCSRYSTLRGSNQRIISMSMYNPKDNPMFNSSNSLNHIRERISDMTKLYPDWILRVYHDETITDDVICSIECAHDNVDFCNTNSLGNLGSVSSYIPPKIWRFIPVGDELVDIMASRDLDSPITQRELDAVNEWISTNKAWHVMRDHPMHDIPMLGGMWGFFPALNRIFGKSVLAKILDRTLVPRYNGGDDQTFLSEHVWPHIQRSVIAHDSFSCTRSFGKDSHPWPTRRLPFNNTDCHVGCIRPCCVPEKPPFGECPIACRPKNHSDWTTC